MGKVEVLRFDANYLGHIFHEYEVYKQLDYFSGGPFGKEVVKRKAILMCKKCGKIKVIKLKEYYKILGE